jgi:hypothetical protein
MLYSVTCDSAMAKRLVAGDCLGGRTLLRFGRESGEAAKCAVSLFECPTILSMAVTSRSRKPS